MSVKQDRGYARTAQDLETKYNYGKSFQEVLGIISDFRDEVDEAQSEIRDEIKEQSTTLSRNAEEITAKAVEAVRTELSDSITEIEKSVELKLDADAVNIVVDNKIANGVDRVETKTGYRLDSNGLDISKAGDEIHNTIDHTGMYVKRGDEEMLKANKDGVVATDLHAKTYLLIGSEGGRSRFEDYDVGTEKRTGCFWVGG